MYGLLTACGRTDLLLQTLRSLNEGVKLDLDAIFIHEDSRRKWRVNEVRSMYSKCINCYPTARFFTTNGQGQHKSIEQFFGQIARPFVNGSMDKYYLHLEDDWEFNNSYDWMKTSQDIMEMDDKVIKVLAREGSPHPCEHDHLMDEIPFGYLQPWENKGIKWHGFSWNPGVTRLDLLNQFKPFPKWEQDLAEQIYAKGFKVVELGVPVYKHIGDNRSTHE